VDRNGPVSIATRHGLDGPGIKTRWGARFSATSQAGPGAHPISYIMDIGFFLGGKAAGGWRRELTPSTAEVKERVELSLSVPS